MSFSELDDETSKRLNEKLDIILMQTREINAILTKAFKNNENSPISDEEKKNSEHVKRSDESIAPVDDESSEKNFENKSGKNEQRPIDQKSANVVKKFHRVAQSRRSRKSTSTKASSKVSAEFACEVYWCRLQLVPLNVFRRKKKYKCDDGG
jgi:hypothetical protein